MQIGAELGAGTKRGGDRVQWLEENDEHAKQPVRRGLPGVSETPAAA